MAHLPDMFRTFLTLLLAGCLLVSAAPTHSEERSHGESADQTNAERFRRGLPPKSPFRRFNATSTKNYLPKRSAPGTLTYIQASPVVESKRATKERGGGTPYDTISYVTYQSNTYVFGLTIDPTQATPFYFSTSGTADQNLLVSDGQGGYDYLSSLIYSTHSASNTEMAAGNGMSVLFEMTTSASTVDASRGKNTQSAIWYTPSTFPGTVKVSYHNYDSGGPTNLPTYVMTVGQGSYPDVLGAAPESTDFPNFASNIAQVNLKWIDTLPT